MRLIIFSMILLLIFFLGGCNSEEKSENTFDFNNQNLSEKTNSSYADLDIEEEVSIAEAEKEEPERTIPELPMENIDKAIELSGNDVLELSGKHYIIKNSIYLKDNAKMIITDAVIDHQHEYTFQYEVKAEDDSRIIMRNSSIITSCRGSLNWNFFDNTEFIAENIFMPECNTWNYFTNNAKARITGWDYFGGTYCEATHAEIRDSKLLEIELCYPNGAVIDTELPSDIDDFTFPNEGAKNVDSQIHFVNSSIIGWGLNLNPHSDITIRNTPAVTFGIILGLPYQHETVILDYLAKQHYDDMSWNMVDARLRLINTTVYGWEPNAFAYDNTLIIRNSNISGPSISSGSSKIFLINTTVGLVRASEDVKITLENSTLTGDAIAVDEGIIELINSEVQGNTIKEGNGKIIMR